MIRCSAKVCANRTICLSVCGSTCVWLGDKPHTFVTSPAGMYSMYLLVVNFDVKNMQLFISLHVGISPWSFSAENPYPNQGELVTVLLNQTEEHVKSGGAEQRIIIEILFEMNYKTGQWRRLQRKRIMQLTSATPTWLQWQILDTSRTEWVLWAELQIDSQIEV